MPTPISSCDSGIPDPRHSPDQAAYSRGSQYEELTGHLQGLGIVAHFGHTASLTFEPSVPSVSQQPGPNIPPSTLQSQPQAVSAVSQPERAHSTRRQRPLAPRPGTGPTQTESSTAIQRRDQPQTTRHRKRKKSLQNERIEEYTEYLHSKSMPWTEVSRIINSHFDTHFNNPCLQMRLTRRRKRRAEWSEGDVSTCIAPLWIYCIESPLS